MTGRIVSGGYCSYLDIVRGKVSAKDYFAMQRMADWRDYMAARAWER